MQHPQTDGDWVTRYSRSHQHPVNLACHLIGIPMILGALVVALACIVRPDLWPIALLLFAGGWILQFVGHWFEGKPPEFLSDWRFLLVGLKWWVVKVRGRG